LSDTATIALSLVSHTNVGKTTLARTLLGIDIGEVRDEPHVTLLAERHTLIESPAGDRLQLWDTPGFGDSVRLAKRLAQAGNPIGWFLTEVWDRFRDRGFWSSQRAVRNIVDTADVVLYLVNASEAPADAGYLDPEMRVMTLIGKPVVVLLNQLGPPRSPAEEAAEIARWRERVRSVPVVREVIALDAFARCWVQEGRLLDAVAPLLDASGCAPPGLDAAAQPGRPRWRCSPSASRVRPEIRTPWPPATGPTGSPKWVRPWACAAGPQARRATRRCTRSPNAWTPTCAHPPTA